MTFTHHDGWMLLKIYQHSSTAHMTKFLPALMEGKHHLIALLVFCKASDDQHGSTAQMLNFQVSCEGTEGEH